MCNSHIVICPKTDKIVPNAWAKYPIFLIACSPSFDILNYPLEWSSYIHCWCKKQYNLDWSTESLQRNTTATWFSRDPLIRIQEALQIESVNITKLKELQMERGIEKEKIIN